MFCVYFHIMLSNRQKVEKNKRMNKNDVNEWLIDYQ